MSEIKVGDFVSYQDVYVSNVITAQHFCTTSKMRGKVLEIIEEALLIEFPFTQKTRWIHRTHCRKLAKVRKCDNCKGKGEVIYAQPFFSHECAKCNGRGKVKV
jgi:hypothetical protein